MVSTYGYVTAAFLILMAVTAALLGSARFRDAESVSGEAFLYAHLNAAHRAQAPLAAVPANTAAVVAIPPGPYAAGEGETSFLVVRQVTYPTGDAYKADVYSWMTPIDIANARQMAAVARKMAPEGTIAGLAGRDPEIDGAVVPPGHTVPAGSVVAITTIETGR